QRDDDTHCVCECTVLLFYSNNIMTSFILLHTILSSSFSNYAESYFLTRRTIVISMVFFFFFFQAEDGIRDATVTGVQTCALPIPHCRASGPEPKPPSMWVRRRRRLPGCRARLDAPKCAGRQTGGTLRGRAAPTPDRKSVV